MIIKTKDFQEAANTILLAADLDKTAANLELLAKNSSLYLNVTNREYYVSVKFALEQDENFRAVIEAPLFLSLISGITAETFSLDVQDRLVLLKAGKSSYKLPMIYENDSLMALPIIKLANKTVEMPISNDILKSILNVNSKELLKVKNLDVNELQKLYYIDETGCFTFTTGACLNSFTLEKPVKLLLNERIVKLFKLFKDDVQFSFGYDSLADGSVQSKAIFETSNIYVAALITNDDTLINKVQGPCNATKTFIKEKYSNSLVLSATALSNAISRLILFTKNSINNANMHYLPVTATITADDLTLSDNRGNSEVIEIENGSFVDGSYEMIVNLADLKLVLDSCKNEHITLNCGNHRSIVISRGNINNLIPEGRKN